MFNSICHPLDVLVLWRIARNSFIYNVGFISRVIQVEFLRNFKGQEAFVGYLFKPEIFSFLRVLLQAQIVYLNEPTYTNQELSNLLKENSSARDITARNSWRRALHIWIFRRNAGLLLLS